MHFLRRLQGQLQGGNREIAKAAHTLTELDSLTDDIDLTGIAVVDAEAAWVATARQQVRESAEEMLKLSFDTHNQVQLGTALQVFRSLGLLATKVAELVDESLTAVDDAGRALLLNPELADDGIPVAVRRANLWTGMDQVRWPSSRGAPHGVLASALRPLGARPAWGPRHPRGAVRAPGATGS